MKADTLPALLRVQMHRYGERVALRRKDLGIWKEISWRAYYQNVKEFCLGLVRLGFERGDRLAILSEGRPEWLFADLGTQSAGGIRVGVYPTSPPSQVKYVVEHSGAAFFVAGDQEQADKILAVKDELPLLKRVIVIDMKGMWSYKDPILLPFGELQALGRGLDREQPGLFDQLLDRVRPEDTALIVYTSGTTGPPKGAMMSHANTLGMVDSLARITPFYDTDSMVSYLPLNHVAESLMSIFIPLKFGCTVNFAESPDTVQESLYEISPTVFLGVPRIWEKLLSSHHIKMENATALKRWIWRVCAPIGMHFVSSKIDRGRVSLGLRFLYVLAYLAMFRAIKDRMGLVRARNCYCGGAPVSPEVLKFFHSLGVKVREVYGMTETAGITTIQDGEVLRFGTVGRPVPGMEVKISDAGEILMRGIGVFQGYHRDREATARTVVGGWLHSGDVGHLGPDGELAITDRMKDILITAGGKNLSPSEIENRLKFSPYINEAIVIGDRRKYLTALIQIEYDTVSDWAQKNRIPFTTFKSLAMHPAVRDLIAHEVEMANKDLAQVETIKKFSLLEKELDHDDGEITATKKVKRKKIEEIYRDKIEAMYRGS
ncbi:MAG: AMP-dependent synthetase/ligase [Thermodesulfobacteriota bacterium]